MVAIHAQMWYLRFEFSHLANPVQLICSKRNKTRQNNRKLGIFTWVIGVGACDCLGRRQQGGLYRVEFVCRGPHFAHSQLGLLYSRVTESGPTDEQPTLSAASRTVSVTRGPQLGNKISDRDFFFFWLVRSNLLQNISEHILVILFKK